MVRWRNITEIDSAVCIKEAMAITGRAMTTAKLKTSLNANEIKKELDKFKDNTEVSNWAKSLVAACSQSGLVAGYNGKITPKKNITRAETAAIVRRILQTAKLIN